MKINTPILPPNQHFAKQDVPHQINREDICIYIAIGFFMDGDTFWKDEICLLPAHKHVLDDKGYLIRSIPNFKWHYSPRNISFEQTLNEYLDLLTKITKEQIGDNKVILPLSGGLDSRSQAMVLKDLKNIVHGFSYAFKGGYPETKIAKKIANSCGFQFSGYTIENGYLWNCIEDIASINQCYSEFTHPRQMAVLDEVKNIEGIFSLGHWGDVLFDRGAPESVGLNDLKPFLFKKMVKPKGFELAETLWEEWKLDGNFKDYLYSRIESALGKINIDNASAKARAFKTQQWAHRWTTTNLSVFKAAHPITLPYYDDRMIKFICTVPEEYLADRRLQLAHLEMDKELSSITWQAQRPFSIKNRHQNISPLNLPYRIYNKLQRDFNAIKGKPYIQRNWELQFLGKENEKNLQSYLYSEKFVEFIPKQIIDNIYSNFKSTDPINYAHPLSMLLTLSIWNKFYN